jgi:hydroxypyruvate isomerase
LNVSEGDPRHGSRGLAGVPGAGAEFLRNCDSVLRVVERTGARHINVLAGNRSAAGVEQGRDVLIERLSAFAERAAQVDAALLVEQLNPFDHPDYLLTDPVDALEIVRRVRANARDGRIGMLADVYHLGRAGVDPVAFFEQHGAAVGHVQIADVPGRGQPGTGRLPIGDALAALFRTGYDGHVGIEYALGSDGVAGIPRPDELWAGLEAARSTPGPVNARMQGE